MTDAVKNGDTSLKDLSIDEIFTRYPVHSVRNLHREYNASVHKAKADLHSLVGKKYRDLIQIAEDIDKMNDMSKSIDDKLTNLSYTKPRYVQFGANSYANFDTKIREENAKAARSASKNTIFNNIVNNQLLSFDLKLQNATHVNSRILVHMAKVYFTIDSVFQSSSSEAAFTNKNLAQYKSRFNAYLEKMIASRLPHLSPYDISDTSIIASSDSQWLESDSVDYLDGSLEDDHEENSDDESFESPSSKKYFGGTSSPMANCIVAYVILNSNDPNLECLEQVASKILDLRFKYLESLFNDAMHSQPRSSCNIKFSFIIAFAESTYSCIKKHFVEGGSSDIASDLRRVSTWRAHEFIGFHNWFENEVVEFDASKYASLEDDFLKAPESNENSFSQYISRVFNEIVTNADESDPIKRAKRALSLLHNFVAACRKAEVLAEANDTKSLTVEFFAVSDLPHTLLEFVLSFVQDLLAKEKACMENDIIGQIQANFADSSTLSAASYELFDKNAIDLIEGDFEKYFSQVLALSSSNANSEISGIAPDASHNLEHWFAEQKSLSSLISLTGSSVVADMIAILNKPYSNAEPFEAWGTFTVESCKSGFSEFVEQRECSLRAEINQLLDKVIEFSHSSTDVREKLHYTLKLIHLLKENSLPYSDKRLQSKMDSSLRELFQRLFDAGQVQSTFSSAPSYLDILSDPLTLETTLESGTVPLWPHLIVNSSIEGLSAALLSSKYLSSSELFEIFSCAGHKSIFVSVKNSWVSKVLVESSLLASAKALRTSNPNPDIPENTTESTTSIDGDGTELVDTSPVEGSSNDSTTEVGTDQDTGVSTHQLSTSCSRQLMANVAFALCFVSEEPLTTQSPELESIVERVNAMSESRIEEPTLEIIIRGANEFYKSSRNLYLPLSVN